MADGRQFAPMLTPEKKVSVEDAKAMLRNHFDGTEHDPYTNGLNGNEPWRPISVFRTYESHVMQVRPELPQEIGEVTYVGLGMADLTAFCSLLQWIKSISATLCYWNR